MATWEESLANGIVDGFCAMQRATNAITDFWNTLAPNPVTEAFSNLGNATYRRVCNREPVPPSTDVPGGQCAGVQYRVEGDAQIKQVGGGGVVQTVPFISQTCPTGIFGPASVYWKDLGGGFAGVWLRGLDSVGAYAERAVTGALQPEPDGLLGLNPTFIRCDGLPDDCGTPTPTPTPDNYNIVDIDITYEDNDGLTVNIPTNIEFRGPLIDIDGSVHIPIRLTYIDPTLNVEVKVDADFNVSTGDITFDFGGSQGGDGRGDKCTDKPTNYEPTDPIPDPIPEADSDDEEKPDDPETETIIRGVVVNVTSVPSGPTILFGGVAAPDAYLPDLGLIWFKCRVGGSSVAWFGGIRVQTLRQLILCEWPGGALDWGWSPRPGIVATVTPIRSRVDRPTSIPGGGI